MDTSIFRYVLEVEKYRNITQAAKRPVCPVVVPYVVRNHR